MKLVWTENVRRVKIEVVSSKLFEQIKEVSCSNDDRMQLRYV